MAPSSLFLLASYSDRKGPSEEGRWKDRVRQSSEIAVRARADSPFIGACPEMGSLNQGRHAAPKGSSACWDGRVETIALVSPSHMHIHAHTVDPHQCSRGLAHAWTHTCKNMRASPLTRSSLTWIRCLSCKGRQTHPGFPREGEGRKHLLFPCSGGEAWTAL